jgi:hypothetical protein
MLSKNGDYNKIEAQRPYIVDILNKLGILYHDLVLMKPYADLYIDDKSIPAHKDLEKETGLYLFEEHASRQHNKIISDGNKIVKQGELRGENYYYSKIPENLKCFFPKVYTSNNNHIELSKINKSTYSSLLMCKKLTKSDIDALINSINKIHKTCSDSIEVDLSWAYKQKVTERLDHYKDLYEQLGFDSYFCNSIIDTELSYSYGMIHGDPVFTNVFSDVNLCKFIDPRGEWDGKLTNSGDKDYDYAKILQSLYGYDYALHNESIEQTYLTSLREYYLDTIKQITNIDQLKIKTKLLFISMIPFHKEDIQRCARFKDILLSI